MDRFQKIIQNLLIKKIGYQKFIKLELEILRMSLSPFDDKIYMTNHGAREAIGLGQQILEKTMVGKF